MKNLFLLMMFKKNVTMIRLIIFDFDDTITDNSLLDLKSFYFTCKKFGIKFPTKNKILKFRREGLLVNDISEQLVANNI